MRRNIYELKRIRERNRYFPIFYSIIWDEGKVQWRTGNTLHVSETC